MILNSRMQITLLSFLFKQNNIIKRIINKYILNYVLSCFVLYTYATFIRSAFKAIFDKANNTLISAFFNYITAGAFTPVGSLLAPVVKHDFQTSWALLIVT